MRPSTTYSLHQPQGNKEHGTERSGYLYKKSDGSVLRSILTAFSLCVFPSVFVLVICQVTFVTLQGSSKMIGIAAAWAALIELSGWSRLSPILIGCRDRPPQFPTCV